MLLVLLMSLMRGVAYFVSVFFVAIVCVCVAYYVVPPFHLFCDRQFILPAMAASRKGAWAKDPKYWAYTSPKDHCTPRNCNGDGVPPFDFISHSLIRRSTVSKRNTSHTARHSHKDDASAVPLLIPT